MIQLLCNTIIQEEDIRDRFITQMNQIEMTIIDQEDQSSDKVQNQNSKSEGNEQNKVNVRLKVNDSEKVRKYPISDNIKVTGDIHVCEGQINRMKMEKEAISAKRVRHNNEQK